jgi:hypothetical protein
MGEASTKVESLAWNTVGNVEENDIAKLLQAGEKRQGAADLAGSDLADALLGSMRPG